MKRKRKGFTLVELLVVIAIIALLMSILMPVLGRVRALAYRVVCGSKLSGIGKAMLIYSNDYEEEFPRAGGRGSIWDSDGEIDGWKDAEEKDAFGSPPLNFATITSSFYYLIRYVDMTPKQFVCKGDIGTKVFKLSDGRPKAPDDFELEDAWDFGQTNKPGKFCSYAYHTPYNKNRDTPGYPVTAVSSASSPLCADRNPYLDKNAEHYIDGKNAAEEKPPTWEKPGGSEADYYKDLDHTSNSACHQREGQNVLFQDAHVSFEKQPVCGINNDNIYKPWPDDTPTPAERAGTTMLITALKPNGWDNTIPEGYEDAFLVSEKND